MISTTVLVPCSVAKHLKIPGKDLALISGIKCFGIYSKPRDAITGSAVKLFLNPIIAFRAGVSKPRDATPNDQVGSQAGHGVNGSLRYNANAPEIRGDK